MRLVAALAALASALLLASCGGSTPEASRQSSTGIPRSVAEPLAAASESLAASLEAGDECGAVEQADDLKKAADEAIASGRVPAAYQDELERAVTELQDDVDCEETPGPKGKARGHDKDPGGGPHGKGEKKGHDKHDDDQGDDAALTTTTTTTTAGTTTEDAG